ncbi:MAG TPA: sialate O-acetylesterase [Paludibacter sp.]|nr:sialate O-acetylesterase [Paludibacter sp.]
MKARKLFLKLFLLAGFFLFSSTSFSRNPNFHIYLCFGQSNMEGQGAIEAQDRTVDSRFKVLQSLDCTGRTKGVWYTAIPPLCQCNTGLSPADYFGRTMVKYLPDSITVGVINVAVGGSDIRLFDKDLYQNYDSTYTDEWFLSKIRSYGGNPRKHLMDLAKLAQQDGVIKGILIHQGEANSGDSKWPSYVKKVYEDMLSELSLSADTVPLLAGEVLSEPGSCCGTWMNPVINKLPMTIPTAYVISANGLTGQDPAHFNSASYRTFGIRYATKMLSLMGIGAKVFEPEMYYFEPECSELGTNWNLITDKTASNNSYVTIKAGMNNTTEVSADSANTINFNFNARSDTTFYVYARVYCTTLKSDSYWFKMDNGSFEYVNGLPKSAWTWAKIKSYDLKAGKHTLAIANGEEGARLDKIYISNVDIAPTGMGDAAVKVCNPVVYSLPGKIEAESYFYQSGTTTASTGDTDGVSDVTSVDTNDYLEYLVNVPTDTVYKATFRYASISASGAGSLFIDEKEVGSISLESTGSFKTYKSTSLNIPVKAGRHTLKLSAISGGFILNWMMFEKVVGTGIADLHLGGVSVFPNPTSGALNIKCDAFRFSNVDILDYSGRRVYKRKFDPTNQFVFNPQLRKGNYILKLFSKTHIRNIKIVVE